MNILINSLLMFKPQRLLYSITKSENLPTIIFFCCVHGNENAGYVALQSIIDLLKENEDKVEGNFYAIFGNQEAYLQDQRFIHKDLNRIWTKSHLEESTRKSAYVSEYNELAEIYNVLHTILKDKQGPVYSIDLHTTSGPTKPFIIMNDALINRDFVKHMGYPVIFNIESFIEGSLLNMLNDLGHVSIGFEAGEHKSNASVAEFKRFCLKAMNSAGLLNTEELVKDKHANNSSQNKTSYFEIVYRQNLLPSDDFKIAGNFLNFQKLKKGDRVAFLNDRPIYAPKDYQIFMPLYQKKGEDGFFYINRLSSFKLKFAKVLRQLRAENILTIIPGINKINFYTLSIPRTLCKYIPKRVLFALGYRKSLEIEGEKIYFTKQERKIRILPKQAVLFRKNLDEKVL